MTRCVLLALSALVLAFPATAAPLDYPDNKEEPVIDVYHGTEVADPYRWLEDMTDPKVEAWVTEQGALTRRTLDALPGRDKLMGQYEALWSYPLSFDPSVEGDYLFWQRREPMINQPVVMVAKRGEPLAAGKVFLDPNTFSEDGTVALDWRHPSPDGSLVAYGTSEGGSERSTLHLRRTDTLEELPDVIPDTRAAAIAWKPDASGFYYTRYPAKGSVPEGDEQFHRRVWYHQLGTDPATDPLIFGGEGLAKETWVDVSSSSDDRAIFVSTSLDWSKNDLYLRMMDAPQDAPFLALAEGLDGQTAADLVGDTLVLMTNVDHPRFHILTAPLSDPSDRTEIIPEGAGRIENMVVVGGNKLAVQFLENAYSKIRIFEPDGTLVDEVELPTLGSVSNLTGEPDGHDLTFYFHSFAFAPTIYRYDLGSKDLATLDQLAMPFDPESYDVRQEWATSKDGTRVPMFVVMQKGRPMDGSNPTILSGYGGFDVSETPGFSRALIPWLASGGIYVVANLRGGGEFGASWHEAGRLDKKQNVFDDFYACAELLIDKGYTNSDKLAISGGSNGGLLVGAAMTQRPELFKAVICAVPLLDMLRYQHFLLGRLWVPEYGDAEVADQFPYLYAYSPYHHVEEGVDYPSVLFMSGDQDSRVDPLHARKMAALMQEKRGGERPILLRVELKAGHGQGTPLSKLLAELVDQYSFLAWQLGMEDFPAEIGISEN